MTITATSGLISGLDYESIIDATMEIEREPIEELEYQQSDYLAKISSYGFIKSSMSSLQSSVHQLSEASDLVSYTGSSSDSDILTVSTDDDANTGTYYVTVNRLAKSEIVNSYAGFESSDEEIGTGTLSIATGDDDPTEITIDSENNSLEGIAQSINESDAGVSATVIKLNSGAYALSLTADDTGKAISFSITDDDGDNTDESGLSRLYSDPTNESMDVTQEARTAGFIFNGLEIERESNTIDDLIEGVTINLVNADTENEVTIKVVKDYSSILSALESFVTAYNSMVEVFDEAQYYNSDSDEAGTLFGDYSCTLIRKGMINLLRTTVDGVDDAVNSLSDLGVEMDADGYLSYDSSSFDDLIETYEDDLLTFFENSDDDNQGFAVAMDNYLESYVGSDGIIESKTDSYQTIADNLDDEIERKEELLDAKEERLWDYYNSLEEKLSELSTLQSAVESMISSLTSSD